jgi:hypothetical protein
LRLAIIVLAAIAAFPAIAEETKGDWFKSLKQPITGASCCDISDCKRTKAEFKGGQWWADVPGGGAKDAQVTPIPNEKVLKDKFSFDGEAYVCSGYDRRIYCFVPPSPGA